MATGQDFYLETNLYSNLLINIFSSEARKRPTLPPPCTTEETRVWDVVYSVKA